MLIVIFATVCHVYMDKVDTIYAIKYGKCFSEYNIIKVDRFLDDDTFISYNGTTRIYKELKSNVEKAFKEKRFVMGDDSYGYGNGFVDGIQEVGIQSYVSINGESREVYIKMVLKKTAFKVKVESLSCNDRFWGYLFFGESF